MAAPSLRVPAIVVSSVIFLVLGFGIGTVGEAYLGANWLQAMLRQGDKRDLMPVPPDGPFGMVMGGKGGVPSMGGIGDGKAGKEPSARIQLRTLVAKLDVLTQKPLTITLDDEQKKKVKEQLNGLAAMDELTEDDAKQRLDSLLETLKDQKESLEASGFRWPGDNGAAQMGKEAANPFKEDGNAKHLQSLEQRLTKAAS
jgi:hypothetical protein